MRIPKLFCPSIVIVSAIFLFACAPNYSTNTINATPTISTNAAQFSTSTQTSNATPSPVPDLILSNGNLTTYGIDLIGKIIIPVITFLAGLFVAFIYRQFDKKRELRRLNIKELQNLMSEWYEQYRLFAADIRMNRNNPNAKSETICMYVTNTKLVPQTITCLEVLKQFAECAPLVKNIENFLKLTTNYGLPPGVCRFHCSFCFVPSQPVKTEKERIALLVGDVELDFNKTLMRLDVELQEYAKKAAKFL
jgi:hypothetical protein